MLLMDENSFGRCQMMRNDSDGAPFGDSPYSEATLKRMIGRKSQWFLTLWGQALGSESGDSLIVDLFQRARGLSISIRVKNPALVDRYEQFLATALQWVGSLPDISSAIVYDSGCDVAAVHAAAGLSRPPACFTTHLRWVHVLAPKFYSLFLSREVLLAAPWVERVEIAGGLIVMRTSENPFEGASPATLERLGVVTDYLLAHDRFMKD